MSNSQQSFYFGAAKKALLATYYPPSAVVMQRNHGVVLCPALGQEYLRSHRALRQVAMLLAREGFHVLRFDYFGTGDSAGELEEATLEQWLEDIRSAADEIFNISGCEQRSIIGLRLGAALALLQSAQQNPVAWHSITLWEPIINGTQYLADYGHSAEKPLSNLLGFPIQRQLVDDIAAIDLRRVTAPATRIIHCITSGTEPLVNSWLAQLKGIEVNAAVVPIAGDWAQPDEFMSAMLPREMILKLVSNLAGDDAQ